MVAVVAYRQCGIQGGIGDRVFCLNRILKWQLAAFMLLPFLFGGAAFLCTGLLAVPEFSAMATAVVQATSRSETDSQNENALASQMLAMMVVRIAQSGEIAEKVATSLNDPVIEADKLRNSVKVTVIPDSNIVCIKYSNTDAVRTAGVANRYIDVLEAELPAYYQGALLMPLDEAIVPQDPNRPILLLYTLAGVLAGLGFAMILTYLHHLHRSPVEEKAKC